MCVYVWVSQEYDKVMNERFFKHNNVTLGLSLIAEEEWNELYEGNSYI